MRKQLLTGLVALGLFGGPMIMGCDKTVAKDETTKTAPDGTTTKDKMEVKKTPDGGTVKTEEHKVDK